MDGGMAPAFRLMLTVSWINETICFFSIYKFNQSWITFFGGNGWITDITLLNNNDGDLNCLN
jgi:hypothetical protein